ncbi:MAG: hypothetical protein QOE77_2820 [Blastocatellia bacterium]|nr:hypothetical protein [Blastocatellia bacterium]
MKLAFRSSCAAVALLLLVGALSFVQAQTSSATPDPFVAQITSSPAGVSNNFFQSHPGDISGNGRFVAIESNGDISTEKTAARNNADGNREIFLFDYAQRRIFQITDTKNLQKIPSASPTPTPTPAASPTPTPGPTPADFTQVEVEVSNNRPVISNNGRWIVFSSNAVTPGLFDGNANRAALLADGNQEVFLYFIPATTAIDLSSGAEAPFVNLATGTFTQVTNTPASGVPQPGSGSITPSMIDDNREATLNDNGSVVAFVSTRNITGGNADANPEVFVYIRATATTVQVTNTPAGTILAPILTQNPAISGSGAALAFLSNANISAGGSSANSDLNAEVYLATVNTTTGASTVIRQVTRTKTDAAGATINLFQFGRRMSRDGSLIALESLADSPKGDGSFKQVYVTFVYDVALDTFSQVGPRGVTIQDIFTFPTFTDYDVSLHPASISFSSILNFRPDGTVPESGKESEGLNPQPTVDSIPPQVYLVPLPATLPPVLAGPFTRITNIPSGIFQLGIRPLFSDSRRRMTFAFERRELGGGNQDASPEVFYQLSPTVTSEPTATISLFTGASQIPVASPSASPTPTPSPAPFGVAGLAPGELAIARATVPLAPSSAAVPNSAASETTRSPALPIELNGVSVSIANAAAGLYAVSATEINFVVPIGLIPPSGTSITYPIVINVHNDTAGTGTTIRGTVTIQTVQPDIFTTTNGPLGRAIVCNITNSLTSGCLGEPFSVTSVDSTGATVPTVLEINLTGVRYASRTAVTVRIGTIDITGDNVTFVGPTGMPGFDKIDVKLPATLAGAGNVPIIVTVGSITSRTADTAPRVTIN